MNRFSALAIVAIFFVAPVQAQEKKDKVKDEPMIGGIPMNFVKLPKATFWMGWSSYTKPKWESKQIEIKEHFEIATCPVIQKHWEALMGKNPSWFSRQGGGKEKVEAVLDVHLDRFPVEMVSWPDAQEFVKELNKREKGTGWTYRLPTQAEWEYACRGGATTKEECSFDFYFEKPTNDISSNVANINAAWIGGKLVAGPWLGRTCAVGSPPYKPNKLGLYDMHGNVRTWCDDQKGGKAHVLRGGCHSYNGYQCAAGYWYGPVDWNFREYDLGVRVVRERTDTEK